MFRTCSTATLVGFLAAGLQLVPPPPPARAAELVEIAIDPAVRPALAVLPGLGAGAERRVAAVADPGGERSDFVVGEVLLLTEGGGDLEGLLGRYDGEVLTNGAVPEDLGPGAGTGPPDGPTWHVVRIQLANSPLDDLADNLAATFDFAGEVTFTSEAAARTAAAVARERLDGLEVDLNWVFAPDAVLEHADGNGGNIDFGVQWWMNEDDDPGTPEIDGISTGVVHAWEYLEYQGHPMLNPWQSEVQKVAILDNGFALDETTGEPRLGNLDYFDTLAAPLQFDFVQGDGTAGGEAPRFPWHGQMVFGVAAAYSHNLYGAAGTAGRYGRPIPLRIDYSAGTASPALATAIAYRADVVNLSYGGTCNWFCRRGYWWVGFGYQVDAAHDYYGMVLIASAGNEGRDLDDTTRWPCEHRHILCVGAINADAEAYAYSNFDGGVDIWAPSGYVTTVDPVSDQAPPGSQLAAAGGTSSAAPWVAGVAALLKVLEPSLKGDEVRDILRFTANSSADPKVAAQGYVDAFRAALVARPNLPPAPEIFSPAAGASLSYLTSQGVMVHARDPESDAHRHDFFALGGVIEVTSSRDGLICRMDDAGVACPLAPLSVGTHTITAVATDPYGSTGSDSITIQATNSPPLASISSPPGGAVFGDDQRISLNGVAVDPEDDLQVSYWESSLDGFLGYGESRLEILSVGTHTITFRAYDEQNASASDSVVIQVVPGTGRPSALIFEPDEGDGSVDGVIQLQGAGVDHEDGALPGTALVWTSSRDGYLGSGNNLTVTLSKGACAPLHHVVTLTVTDSDGNTASTSVNVYVGVVC